MINYILRLLINDVADYRKRPPKPVDIMRFKPGNCVDYNRDLQKKNI